MSNGQSFSESVQGLVPPIRQPSGMTCWATVSTRMVSWQESVSLPIEEVMDRAGSEYRAKFDADQGLPGNEKNQFLAALGLRAEPPMSYSVDGLRSLLAGHGPLWVTTDEDPSEDFAIHARIITGMSGNGNPDDTSLRIVDPATGSEGVESFSEFMRKFEDVAIGDMADGGDFRVQVVHF